VRRVIHSIDQNTGCLTSFENDIVERFVIGGRNHQPRPLDVRDIEGPRYNCESSLWQRRKAGIDFLADDRHGCAGFEQQPRLTQTNFTRANDEDGLLGDIYIKREKLHDYALPSGFT
jgi:hypothetical protein